MNKKLLICAAVATGFLLTACVKKEAPKEEEQTEVASSEPVNLQPLEKPDQKASQAVSEPVQIERIETENTTTEIRRSVQDVEQTETPKVEAQPKANRSANSESEDEAVQAAIAAAMPALEN